MALSDVEDALISFSYVCQTLLVLFELADEPYFTSFH